MVTSGADQQWIPCDRNGRTLLIFHSLFNQRAPGQAKVGGMALGFLIICNGISEAFTEQGCSGDREAFALGVRPSRTDPEVERSALSKARGHQVGSNPIRKIRASNWDFARLR